MTKSEIVEVVAKKTNLTKKAARQVVDSFLDEMIRNLEKGDKVVLSGFGTFKIKKVKDKKSRKNLYSDDFITIKGHRVVRFIVSKTLKKVIR
jgi:DNA-binding protein HU-beta